MIHGRGMWPSFWQRYCTKYLKMWPLRLYAAEQENPVLVFGVRAEESKARATLPIFGPDTFKGMKAYQFPNFCPILKWTEREVWACLKSHGIPVNPAYNYTGRVGCWCCPIKGNGETVFRFCQMYPGQAQRWANLEQEINHTWQERHSITNLLRQARAQMPLFEAQPRFAEVAKC